MPQYPIVLAEFEFHGERWQVWNQNEGIWIVREKTPVNDYMGSEWELVIQI